MVSSDFMVSSDSVASNSAASSSGGGAGRSALATPAASLEAKKTAKRLHQCLSVTSTNYRWLKGLSMAPNVA